MNLSTFLATLFSLSFLFSSAFAVQPNIIILFSDDGGYADIGFQPNCAMDIKNLTPNIDRVARGGVRFSNAYVSGCVCSPSRSGLMTGRYQQRFGFDNNLPANFQSGLPLTETFGTKYLKEIGYTTGLVGKWHLGYPKEFHPNERGFDWFYGLLQGARPYFPMKKSNPRQVFMENDKPTPEGGYTTDRIGDAAVRFIENNKEKPFYLFVSFTAPHAPMQAKPEVLKKLGSIENWHRRQFAGLVVSLDENVGKILDCLDEQKLSENTIVVYTNDNGGQTLTGANNDPLRDKKGSLWEGGIRVPFAMRWPGKIKAGTVIDDTIIALDLLPTFVTLGGGTVKPEWKLDGVDLSKRITGESESLAERPLFWRQAGSNGEKAVRMGKWKLHQKSGNGEVELFDLSADIAESKNLANENPDMKKKLTDLLTAWNSELKQPLWGHVAKGGDKKVPDDE